MFLTSSFNILNLVTLPVVGRGVHRVVQRLVAVLSHEVGGEDDDGRSEAGEGVLPEPAQEGVAPPRVLSLERHPVSEGICASLSLLYDSLFPPFPDGVHGNCGWCGLVLVS